MRSQNIKFIFDEKGNKTSALLSIKEFQNLLEKLDCLKKPIDCDGVIIELFLRFMKILLQF